MLLSPYTRPTLRSFASLFKPQALLARRQISHDLLLPPHDEKPVRVKVKPYPRQFGSFSKLVNPAAGKFHLNTDLFNLMLVSYESNRLRDGLDARQAHAPWLPWPPSTRTHTSRHYAHIVRKPPVRVRLDVKNENVRFEPKERRDSKHVGDPVPVCHVLVICSKKKIHKLAVVRNRVRTRLMSAFRLAFQDPSIPIPQGICIMHAKPKAYDTRMDTLVDQMKSAISRCCLHLSPSAPEFKLGYPQDTPPDRKHQKKKPWVTRGYLSESVKSIISRPEPEPEPEPEPGFED